MTKAVEQALNEIRPMLALHAGNVELVGVTDGVVQVRMLGTCHGCPLAGLTLKAGIEEHLKSRVAGVRSVEEVA